MTHAEPISAADLADMFDALAEDMRPPSVQRDEAAAIPRKFIIARWLFTGVGVESRQWEGDPLHEQSYDSRDRIVSDIWSGEVDDLTQIVEIDLDAGTAREISADVYTAVAEHSFIVGAEPYRDLADELDARGLEYLTQGEVDREAEREQRWRDGPALSGAQLGVGRW